MRTNNRLGETFFDILAEIDAAYDHAERKGPRKVVRTIEAVECLMGFPDVPTSVLYWLYKALAGDPVGARETAHLFDWEQDEKGREKFAMLDSPELAVFWFERAAKKGDAIAQNNLANLLCSSGRPIWNGRQAVYWREKASAQGEYHAMEGLADCLECGHCCRFDPARAKLLRAESRRLRSAAE